MKLVHPVNIVIINYRTANSALDKDVMATTFHYGLCNVHMLPYNRRRIDMVSIS